jgi:hypothetical protein
MSPNKIVAKGAPWICLSNEVTEKSEILHGEDRRSRMEDVLDHLGLVWSPNLVGLCRRPLGPVAMKSTMKTVVT